MKLFVALGVLLMVVSVTASLAGLPEAARLTAPTTSLDHGSPASPSFIPAWTAIAPPASNADRLTSAIVYDPVNDMFYMIGGCAAGDSGTELASNYRYNPATNVWDTMAAMPTPRGWLKGAYVRGKIYVIGGLSNSSTALSNNEEYTISSNTWATKAVRPRAACAQEELVWSDSLVFVLGGTNLSVGFTNVDIYNPFTNSWTTGTALPQQFDMGGAAIIGDTIYILGGVNRGGSSAWANVVQGAINSSDPTQITWTTKAALPAPNAINATAALNGKVYMLGGFENLATPTNALREYDPATNSFTTLDPYGVTIVRNHYLIGRPSEGALYVFGGDANANWIIPNNYYYKYPVPTGVEGGKIIVGKQATETALAQNRPNPAKSVTRIEFALPRAGEVSLKLYNVGGQEVKTLVSGSLSAGAHEASLSAGELATGVYFYRLGFEGKTLSREMIVVR
jgi:N-acetylneuraminic acid mutarotase